VSDSATAGLVLTLGAVDVRPEASAAVAAPTCHEPVPAASASAASTTGGDSSVTSIATVAASSQSAE